MRKKIRIVKHGADLVVDKLKLKSSPIIFLAFSALVFLACFLYPFWAGYFYRDAAGGVSYDELAAFGDSFGVLNTLFSGLAFSGIIVSIFLQSKELRDTRRELEEQGRQFRQQTETMVAQTFDSTFFNMLGLHEQIVSSIIVDGADKNDRHVKLQGRECFQYLFLTCLVGEKQRRPTSNYFQSIVVKLDYPYYQFDSLASYAAFHDRYGHKIGHYFRNIYQILSMIHALNSCYETRKRYSNILRSQLSTYELALLFYNCLSDVGVYSFKPLVEEYEFFEHLTRVRNLKAEHLYMYKEKAFGTTNHGLKARRDKFIKDKGLEEH